MKPEKHMQELIFQRLETFIGCCCTVTVIDQLKTLAREALDYGVIITMDKDTCDIQVSLVDE